MIYITQDSFAVHLDDLISHMCSTNVILKTKNDVLYTNVVKAFEEFNLRVTANEI